MKIDLINNPESIFEPVFEFCQYLVHFAPDRTTFTYLGKTEQPADPESRIGSPVSAATRRYLHHVQQVGRGTREVPATAHTFPARRTGPLVVALFG